MIQTIETIPFILNGKNGKISIIYEENTSIEKSGFSLLEGRGFDINMCIGYPTMHAKITEFEGTGYYASSAWIQIITDEFYTLETDTEPSKIEMEVDVNPALGMPFFGIGYPAEIYDAPCNNLGDYGKLTWIADTYFVTNPSGLNNNEIKYISGFRWGYEEYDKNGKREVKILPFEKTDVSSWKGQLSMLKETFPNLNFK